MSSMHNIRNEVSTTYVSSQVLEIVENKRFGNMSRGKNEQRQ